MINAILAETLRLRSRRIVWLTLLSLLALIALYQLQVGSQIAPPSPAEVAQLQRDYDEYVRDWELNHEQWEAECQESGGTVEQCAQPRPEPSEWGLAPVPFREAVEPAIGFAVYLGGMLLFVAMASLIGAEATTGSLASWLTFLPDRRTVLVSKLAVASTFSVLVGAVAGLLTVLSSSLLAAAYGQPLTGQESLWAMAGRGIVVVAIFGIAGFTVGLLTGSTGASIGVLLGGIFVTYLQSILAFASRWAQPLSLFNPGVNLQAILGGGTTYEVSSGPGSPAGDTAELATRTLSLTHGLGYWAVLLAALVAVTWVVFRRRDVT